MFYDNLLAVCQEKGLKITPVVQECGGKSGSISGWKKGAWPSSDLVVRLAARLNVSTDRLLMGQDAKKEDADAIRGISDDALKVACLWDGLDEPGKAIILGDIYRRAEALAGASEEGLGGRFRAAK